MEHLGRDVGQIAVQEDEERLDHADVVCEARGKRRYKAQEDADQHPTDPHDKEVRDASKHVNGLNGLHLAERLEQVVQDLPYLAFYPVSSLLDSPYSQLFNYSLSHLYHPIACFIN